MSTNYTMIWLWVVWCWPRTFGKITLMYELQFFKFLIEIYFILFFHFKVQ